MRATLTIDWNSVFEYRDGSLYWKIKAAYKSNPGDRAGSSVRQTYEKIGYGNRSYRTHQIIWQMLRGEVPSGYIIDHIDGNKFNNRIENLRVVTYSQNSRNRKIHRDGKAAGLFYNKRSKRWLVTMNLGSHQTREGAEEAYFRAKNLLEKAGVIESLPDTKKETETGGIYAEQP